jgi:hypothetical protein
MINGFLGLGGWSGMNPQWEEGFLGQW